MAKLKKTLPKEFSNLVYGQIGINWTLEDMEKCKNILSECDPNARDRGGSKNTALHYILPVEISKWLIDRGADVNVQTSYGTPLFQAASLGSIENCRLFLNYGVDVNITNYAGETAIFSAVACNRKDKIEIIKLLIEYGANPWHRASFAGQINLPLLDLLSRNIDFPDESVEAAELFLSIRSADYGPTEEEMSKARKLVAEAGHRYELKKDVMPEDKRIIQGNAMGKLYELFKVQPAAPVLKHDGKSPILIDTSLSVTVQHQALWEFLVPGYGSCSNVQGEVIRIIGRIEDEGNRNGGVNWDSEYRKMLQAFKEYLLMGNGLTQLELDSVSKAAEIVNKNEALNCNNEFILLMKAAINWIKQNPNPIELHKVKYKR